MWAEKRMEAILMDLYLLFTYAVLIVAIVFGPLAWAAKHIWHDRRRTQLFAFIAIANAVLFMALIYPLLPD